MVNLKGKKINKKVLLFFYLKPIYHFIMKDILWNNAIFNMYNSVIYNYSLFPENTVCSVKYHFPENMPNLFSISIAVDEMGTATTHQASTTQRLCQSSAFSFPSQCSHNTSTKAKQKLQSWPLCKYRHFCQNIPMKAMIHTHHRQVANTPSSSPLISGVEYAVLRPWCMLCWLHAFMSLRTAVSLWVKCCQSHIFLL